MDKKKDSPRPRERLVEARNERELSQKEVADHLGTSDVNVSRWERGITRPTPYFRRKLTHLFGKTEEELDLTLSGEAIAEAAKREMTRGADTMNRVPTKREAIYDASIPLLPQVDVVGRNEEVARLREGLQAGEGTVVIALHGLPGVGKTTLAITLAHDGETRAYFRDGILWAGLGPTPDISSILSRWSLLLGIGVFYEKGEKDQEALALRLRHAIESRRMLLVIDDAWKLEDALAFKVGGPHCAYLVTTRFPGIASAFAPRATQAIRELGENESISLLRMLAPQLVERETQKVRELAKAVGGLPLALTLLGNYLRLEAYSGQARRIDAALTRLSDAEERLKISEARGPMEGHPGIQAGAPLSLQAVIDVTGKQLAPEMKAALSALAVFPPKPGSFSEVAALAVGNCDAATLDALMDTGLLESAGESRYMLHQTIADYARSTLQDDVAPYERLITYVTKFVEQHKKDYEILELEHNSIIAALESAYQLDTIPLLMHCVYAFVPYLRSRGLYELAEKQSLRAYRGAENLHDDDGKSQALLLLGEIAQRRGNYEQASTYLQEGLNIARQLANSERISALLADLGYITWKRGEYSGAEAYAQEGLTFARQIDNTELTCDLLEILGSVAGSRGEYNKSKEYMEQALVLARKIGDREKICTLLINLGVTQGEQGKHDQGEQYFREALNIARQLGHKEWICAALSNLGDLVSEQGNYTQAEEYFEEALTIARQIVNMEWESLLLLNLGVALQKQGHLTEAEEHFREGLSITRNIRIPELHCVAFYSLGSLQLAQNRIQEAEHSFQFMLEAVPEGSLDNLALAKYGFAQIAFIQGDVKRASDLGKESAAILEYIGHRAAKEVHSWLLSLPA